MDGACCTVEAVCACAPPAPLCMACRGVMAAPDSMKLRMSFFVTRPLIPVPSSREMSMPCSLAMLRTSGLDLVRRNSSAVCSRPLPPVVGEGACACCDEGCAVLLSLLFVAEGAGAGVVAAAGVVAVCCGEVCAG